MPPIPRSLALVLVLAGAPALAEPEAPEGDPIVLTSEDLARVKAKQQAAGAAGEDTTLIIVPTSDQREKGRRAGSRRRYSGADEPDFEAPATSWQEEYYRLKAVALKQAMERGDPIYFGEPAAPADAGADKSDAPFATRTPGMGTCIYARDGELVYAPPGQSCRHE